MSRLIQKLALLGAVVTTGCATKPVQHVVIEKVEPNPPAKVVVYQDTGMPVVLVPPKVDQRPVVEPVVVRPVCVHVEPCWPLLPPHPGWHYPPMHPRFPHPLRPAPMPPPPHRPHRGR